MAIENLPVYDIKHNAAKQFISGVLTSTAEQEITLADDSGYERVSMSCLVHAIDTDMTVRYKLHGEDDFSTESVFIPAGASLNREGLPIEKVMIVEAGVQFQVIADLI